MIDSTYTKTYRTAASMASDKQDRKIGRSRGGLTTKIHFLCNDEAKSMDLIITDWNFDNTNKLSSGQSGEVHNYLK